VIDQRHKEFMRHLTDDFRICAEHLDSENTPFWRRTFFRTAFSMIEVLNAFIATRALEAHALLRSGQIDITACMFLTPRDYRLRDNGTITSTEARRSFLSYTAFVIRTLAQAAGVTKHYLGENGWNDFQSAVAVRHRITHPNTDADMVIGDDDIRALENGVQWYLASIHDIVDNSDIFQLND
jgi:hypothetical protein